MLYANQIPSAALSSSNNRLNHLKAIARSNCLNDSATVNFNKYGDKDGIGFLPVSPFFIDTVIITRHITEEERKLIGSSCLRVFTEKLKEQLTSLQDYSIIPCSGKSETLFQWKLACPESPIESVLSILKTPIFIENNFMVQSIDLTRDLSGSFNLDEVIDYFQRHYNLQIGYNSEELFMEDNMKSQTGNTCFICKTKDVRYKIYLKFPQMLQCQRVRNDMGNRWHDWCQISKSHEDSKFSKTRNDTLLRGLTRMELTFSGLPSLETMVSKFDEFINLFPKELSYSTSHSSMWTAYADCFKHSLIVVDEHYQKTGLAILIYSYNSLTKDLAGVKITNWNSINLHLLTRFTLSSKLPIHLITVSSVSRINGNEIIEISGALYSKAVQDDVTYLLNSKGQIVYHSTAVTSEQMNSFGFSRHENCNLMITPQRIVAKSKVIGSVQLQSEFQVNLQAYTFHKTEDIKKLDPLTDQSSTLPADNLFPFDVNALSFTKLKNLKRGFYEIYGLFIQSRQLPLLVINKNGKLYKLYANSDLKQQVHELPYFAVNEKCSSPLGRLYIQNVCKKSKDCGSKSRQIDWSMKLY